MSRLNPYAKAIVAMLGVVVPVVQTWPSVNWPTVIVAAITAGLVYLVPNTPASSAAAPGSASSAPWPSPTSPTPPSSPTSRTSPTPAGSPTSATASAPSSPTPAP